MESEWLFSIQYLRVLLGPVLLMHLCKHPWRMWESVAFSVHLKATTKFLLILCIDRLWGHIVEEIRPSHPPELSHSRNLMWDIEIQTTKNTQLNRNWILFAIFEGETENMCVAVAYDITSDAKDDTIVSKLGQDVPEILKSLWADASNPFGQLVHSILNKTIICTWPSSRSWIEIVKFLTGIFLMIPLKLMNWRKKR